MRFGVRLPLRLLLLLRFRPRLKALFPFPSDLPSPSSAVIVLCRLRRRLFLLCFLDNDLFGAEADSSVSSSAGCWLSPTSSLRASAGALSFRSASGEGGKVILEGVVRAEPGAGLDPSSLTSLGISIASKSWPARLRDDCLAFSRCSLRCLRTSSGIFFCSFLVGFGDFASTGELPPSSCGNGSESAELCGSSVVFEAAALLFFKPVSLRSDECFLAASGRDGVLGVDRKLGIFSTCSRVYKLWMSSPSGSGLWMISLYPGCECS